MARCGFCGVEVDHKDLWKHQWDNHPEEMKARSEKGRLSPRRAGKGDGKGDKGGPARPLEPKRAAQPLTPVHAALVQFVSQTFVVPNTPALTYGFLCAKKFGFQGDMAPFLQEVIDDFYASRHINYYGEVLQWNGIGSALREPAAPL